ncbi:MAG: extracellular solute-binding protein [Chloroflexi bacterium]|nr:extracellular solute-binding protein [Chloroflexota bacterium]
MKRLIAIMVVIGFMWTAVPVTRSQDSNERITITLWHVNGGFTTLINNFNNSQDKYFIDVMQLQTEQFKNDIILAVDSDSQPDVFLTWGGGTLKEFVDKGAVREIQELDGELGENFISASLSPFTFEDKHYAIPLSLAAVVMIVNPALFEAYNLELPTDWESLLNACAVFNEAGIIPISFANSEKWPGSHWFSYLVTRLGGADEFAAAANRESVGFDDPVFIEAGKKLREIVDANCFTPDFMTASLADGDYITDMVEGRAAMLLAGSWVFPDLRGQSGDQYDQYQVIPFPTIVDDPTAMTGMVGGTSDAYAISWKAPPETERILIELFTSQEFLDMQFAANTFSALVGARIEDPLVAQTSALLSEASLLQLYYDQVLPRNLALAHLDTTAALFNGDMTPEEAAETMEIVAETLSD